MPNQDRPSGTDAVCFTAGPQGIAFSAGVIHAWLASDRGTPKVMAGISAGALSAAALARACQKRDEAKALPPDQSLSPAELESRRWTWFRQYLDAITNEPLKPIWDAIPDPDDYFADKPPVKDLSVKELPLRIQEGEAQAREHYNRLVKLGLWLAGLRVSIGEITTCLVRWVRFKEGYALWPLQGIMLLGRALFIAGKVLLHLGLSPRFTVERVWGGKVQLPRPLFGWGWAIAVVFVADAAYWLLKFAGNVAVWASHRTYLDPFVTVFRKQLDARVPIAGAVLAWFNQYFLHDYWSWAPKVATFGAALALALVVGMVFFRGPIFDYLAHRLKIHRALFDSYSLSRKLFELFSDGGKDVRVSSRLLLVAAPLQPLGHEFGKQVWFEPDKTSVSEALTAALAVPGLFPAVQVTDGVAGQTKDQRLDLIDGARVRQNPLPALFRWLKRYGNQLAQPLFGTAIDDASVHLVYGVPIRPDAASDAGRRERIDLVESANIGLDLARRRDSRMELRQTNFISELALHTQQATGQIGEIYPIFADEIAPESEIRFENNLAPQRKELLHVAASGCRATLETLHRKTLASTGFQPVPCSLLLSRIAADRSPFVQLPAPGLAEVCHCCSKMLSTAPDPVLEAKKFEQRWFERIPLTQYAHLAPHNGSQKAAASHQPRIVFLAAGGVFRGAFHIGVIGAMQAARMTPDLIVGASVGTLMGGALGAISTLREDASKQRLLGELCLTFLEVDRRVALTKGLKNAVKQLGTRGCAVDLSPAAVRRAVRRGTRSDPGFAATGAPSILIDAISTLFLIPHKDTSNIAAQFVAGHITDALKLFWDTARRETLRRLGIDVALIGASLLEERAHVLLGAGNIDAHAQIDLTKDQPYPGISVFATASDLSRSRPLLLPRDLDDTTVYDFVQAGLSSSAFPAAFRPRQQAEVQPGRGATDILYADGGMFDNLPFFPAIEVLAVVQKNWRKTAPVSAHTYLQERLDSPDLFVAASLEGALGKEDENHPPETFWAVHQRAGKLSVNGKLNSFLDNAKLIARSSQLLHDAYADPVSPPVANFMDGIVNAAVLKVTPTDQKHLNGTFAFAKSVGFSQEKVALSIADGCFQTLRSLIEPQDTLAADAVDKLRAADRIAALSANEDSTPGMKNGCPFFRRGDRRGEEMTPFLCPFAQAASQADPKEGKPLSLVYHKCTHDSAHKTKH
jgi:predicted acylesterase/phospholipase RssA